MSRGIPERIERAFAGSTSGEQAADLLQAVREAERSYAQAMSRYSLLGFVLIVAFELMVRSSATDPIQFGSFTITDTGFAAIFIVVGVSWAYLEGLLAEIGHHDLEIAHSTLMAIAYPGVDPADIHMMVFFARPSVYPANYADGASARLSDRLRYRLNFALNGASTLAVAAFSIHAYVELFARYGVEDIRLWVSMGFTVVLIGTGWTIALVWLFEGPDESPVKRAFTRALRPGIAGLRSIVRIRRSP